MVLVEVVVEVVELISHGNHGIRAPAVLRTSSYPGSDMAPASPNADLTSPTSVEPTVPYICQLLRSLLQPKANLSSVRHKWFVIVFSGANEE